MRNQECQNVISSAYDAKKKNFNFDKAISEIQEKYKDKIEKLNNQQDINNKKIEGLTNFLELLHKEDVNETYQKELNDLQEENSALAGEINTLSKQQKALAEENLYDSLDTYIETKEQQATRLYNTLQEQVDGKIKSIQEQAIKTQELFKDKVNIAEQIKKDLMEITSQENEKVQSTQKYKTIAEFNDVAQAYKAFRDTQKNREEEKSLE